MLSHVPTFACTTTRELQQPSRDHHVVLTFDDGLASDYQTALPLLKEHGLQGVFFVSAANVGVRGYTNPAQLREMAAAGMEIASHGWRHEYLTAMSRAEARREIVESKDRLEQVLGREVVSFAPVGGHFRPWMIAAAADAGYRVFATMIPGFSPLAGSPLILRRNHLQAHHDAAYVGRLVLGERRLLARNRLRYEALRACRGALGMRNYDRGKRWLTRLRVSS
jgi:peptidoglycan/xylan/chitin deacetylase (PgdA/CDA1 family)